MGSCSMVYVRINIAIYLAIIIFVAAEASPGYSTPSRRKHREHYGNFSETQQQQSSRNPKFFPILGFVTLPSSTCQTDSGTMGTCMKSKTCQRQGGMASGSCAMNFGVCCVVNLVCSGNGEDTVTQNGTHLLQPSSYTEFCQYAIPRQEGICQIRLDFNSFNIDQGPNAVTFGDCASDTFTVRGASNAIVGPLCGDLTGQHMYLDYGGSDKINLDLFLQSNMMQKWDISVTMIRCDSSEKAPTGCLQYFTTPSGMVKSFNYNNMVQLNNEDYTVCIRSNSGMRKITWKPCMTNPPTTTDFIITGGPPAVDPAGGPAVGIPLSGDDCTTDWVMVLGQNKYCGSQFPDMVTSMSQPFILQVHFNEFELQPPMPCPMQPCPGPENSDALNTGFCLKYTQTPF
ncbi:unnamed protein product [Orchesella dallaii]|uniref:CUB domain-containing protein n=1 Tax=Orchesella dallaii TaxID=48710 RepID=A0ABP1QSI6_9HEXA